MGYKLFSVSEDCKAIVVLKKNYEFIVGYYVFS